jgi:hypothetical protein
VRNHLLVAMGLTGLVIHVLLGVAITRGVPDKTIVAVTTCYLVGALVGLFSRLYAQTKTNMAVEDYGLYNVRLVLTPLLSGLAAISGVLLVAIISTAMQQPQPTAPPVPDLTTIFDLASYRTTLLTAAIFGLTPGLLVERLKQQTEQYKNDLQRTEGARAAPRDPDGQG